ncbi:MAG: hypothetical protein ACD_77C00508G0005 [uncultured bacterium]|nr:MAG: hypothetical protein ACD_77C00508G0005 [uncultured bacterium]HBY01085.1 HIT family protein [Rikenellaceae bacterium]
MSSIFSKIAKGEIPCYKVAESDKYLAFLDINPISKGHTLVIPKEETDYIFDLGSKDLSELMLFAQKVAKGIDAAIPCKRVGIAVIGLEVPHAHVHLLPLNNESDLDFRKPKLKLAKEEMEAIAQNISSKIKL